MEDFATIDAQLGRERFIFLRCPICGTEQRRLSREPQGGITITCRECSHQPVTIHKPKLVGPDGEEIVLLPVRTLAQLAKEPVRDRRFLDHGRLLPMRNVSLFSGDGGTGKSYVAQQLAISTCLSGKVIPWLGLTILEQGNVVYIAAEDEESEVRQRLIQMCINNNLDPALVDSIHIISLVDLDEGDATLAVELKGRLVKTGLMLRVEATILTIPNVKLIVIDNVADVYGANENVKHLVRAFISWWRVVAIHKDCHVMMLHHPSKSGMSDGTGTGGSTQWHNGVRSRLYLERIKDADGNEPDKDRRNFIAKKSNYGPLGDDIELVFRNGEYIKADVAQAFDNVPPVILESVRREFSKGTWRANSQAQNWGGFFVAELIGLKVGKGLNLNQLNPEEKSNRKRIERILATWMRNDQICKVDLADPIDRKKKPHYSIPGAVHEET